MHNGAEHEEVKQFENNNTSQEINEDNERENLTGVIVGRGNRNWSASQRRMTSWEKKQHMKQ